jgi:anti-sigma factor RsiW
MHNPFRVNRTKEDQHLSEGDLLLYVDGELPAKEGAKTQDHLQACWTCRTKMEKIQGTISAFVDYLDGTFARNLGPPPGGWRTFQARLRRVIAETGKLPAPSQPFAPLRTGLFTWPLAHRLAAGLFLTTVIAFLAILFRVPRISADQLIQKAEEARAQRIQAVPQPVVYQRLRVHRKRITPAEDSTVTWETWNDVGNDRLRQRAEEASGSVSAILNKGRRLARQLAGSGVRGQYREGHIIDPRSP